MSYQKHTEQCHYFRRTKKKSDDFIKRRLEERNKKAPTLPVHAIKKPELADKSFALPKIPKKHDLVIPPVQLSIAEIVEEADKAILEKEYEKEEEIELQPSEPSRIYPVLTVDEVIKANAQFAEKQKVSLISLIKLLIPALDQKQVIITLTKQQEEFIGELKIEWQAFLRQYFNDRGITILIRIDEQAETKRQAYTPSEQFQEMLDDHENFRKLVQLFKLKLKQ